MNHSTVDISLDTKLQFDNKLQEIHRLLVRVTRRRVRCAHAAEDIAAEAIARAWCAFGTTISSTSLLHWTLRVARNLAADHAASSRRACRRVESAELAAPDRAPTQPDLSEAIELGRRRLAAFDNETLRLLQVGMGTAEIAMLRGVTTRAVQRSTERVRRALASTLTKD
jgi:DNA-directed RNA polymerase specialized sigma24 family protein